MRGFSISERPLPAIVLNIKDSPAARSFTIVHELVHVLLNKSGVCDLQDDPEGIEVFCNRVAGAVLVPEQHFVAQPEVMQHAASAWSDEGIKALAMRYRVSQQVILRRLLMLNMIDERSYKAKQTFYEKQAVSAAVKAKKGFAPPYTMAVLLAGKLFTRLVLTGYRCEKITGADVSDYLSIRLKHLANIESAVFG